MPAKSKKLIIVGDSAFAEIAKEYFDVDSEYEVVAFSVEQGYFRKSSLAGLPVIPFEKIEEYYTPSEYSVFVAIPYAQLNRLRARLMFAAKGKGYALASYVSPRAFIWRNARFGEHCFIFEDNTIQPFAEIGNNVILWSGNHVGHHSTIHDHCFISSHVVISGFCEIGAYSFLGVNSALANDVIIGRDNWVGPGVTIHQNTGAGMLFSASKVEPSRVSTLRFFKVKEAME